MTIAAIRISAIASAALVLPRTAAACAVCFMGVESPLLDSARLGVLAMAVVLAAVLSAFAVWFRKLAALEAASEPTILAMSRERTPRDDEKSLDPARSLHEH